MHNMRAACPPAPPRRETPCSDPFTMHRSRLRLRAPDRAGFAVFQLPRLSPAGSPEPSLTRRLSRTSELSRSPPPRLPCRNRRDPHAPWPQPSRLGFAQSAARAHACMRRAWRESMCPTGSPFGHRAPPCVSSLPRSARPIDLMLPASCCRGAPGPRWRLSERHTSRLTAGGDGRLATTLSSGPTRRPSARGAHAPLWAPARTKAASMPWP